LSDREVRKATVLVNACRHALGLAIPLVIAIWTAIGARNGLLAKDRLALEQARDLDVVIFDETGTLTRGAPIGGSRRAGHPAIRLTDSRQSTIFRSAENAREPINNLD
jgi:Cu2+-exporting ATPase